MMTQSRANVNTNFHCFFVLRFSLLKVAKILPQGIGGSVGKTSVFLEDSNDSNHIAFSFVSIFGFGSYYKDMPF